MISGTVRCHGCARGYPIRRGVPRFVENDNYAASFGLQWNRFRAEQIDAINGFDLSARRFHNPLTVEEEVLAPCGLRLRGLFFYHFHALPPVFEHIYPEEFRRLSAAMERPTDWRGLFLASSFVVHAQKVAEG